MGQVDLFKTEIDGKSFVKVEVWHGTSKRLAGTRTVVSHINNMFLGVTRGFRYTMRLVYAHFPINVTIEDAGKIIEIRNFLGEKRVRIVKMLEGVTIAKDKAVKDHHSRGQRHRERLQVGRPHSLLLSSQSEGHQEVLGRCLRERQGSRVQP